ncbi:hypothetical protein PVAND_009050 [Polypedilum vanderplanki]|uniref:NACHT domain-containing protein n=1 Tax=Polypedilum vanderplanki TaxID=319348 RepID=A0A9J6CC34_POLVA|nr:hypothetical protein PVAND_009050 [Polypedilum vanderplanki]
MDYNENLEKLSINIQNGIKENKTIEILKCSSHVKALELLANSSFRRNISSLTGIRIKIDGDLSDIEQHNKHVFEDQHEYKKKSKNLTFAPDETFKENCKEEFLEKIYLYNEKHPKHLLEYHLLLLSSKVILSRNDIYALFRFKAIKEAFGTLYMIKEIKPTLQLLSLNKKIKFFFDFTQNSVVYINPQLRQDTRGVFIVKDNQIQVAVKKLFDPDMRNDSHGSLSHECYHCGFHMIFRNDRLPYAAGDEKNKERFNEIIKECQQIVEKYKDNAEMQDIIWIVAAVFEGDIYDKSRWGRELAVRVPHINILDDKNLKIGKQFEFGKEFYKERNFIDTEIECNILKQERYVVRPLSLIRASCNFEFIMNEIKDTQIFLLSDQAGTGKSTTMKHIVKDTKNIYPKNWLAFIDLKHYVKIFEKYQNELDKNIFQIFKEVISLPGDFESEIFKKLFDQNQVILMYDGIDEIAPLYKTFMIELINIVKLSSKNQQWIATRPQYTEEIKTKFNSKAYKLLPFEIEEAKEFVEQFLKSKNIKDNLENLIYEIGLFIEKLEIQENPLLLKIVAELHIAGKLTLETFNQYKLYKEIVDLKMEILNEKGQIANTNKNFDTNISLFNIHQVYALKTIFHGNKFEDFLGEEFLASNGMEKFKWSSEAIGRPGFLFIDNWYTDNEFADFSHRTFAEYFVARFFIDAIKEAIEDADEVLTENEFNIRMKLAIHAIIEPCNVLPVFSLLNGVCNFINDFLSIQDKSFKLCDNFLEFLKTEKVGKCILQTFNDTEHETASYYAPIYTKFIIFTDYNQTIFEIFTQTQENHSKLFQIAFENARSFYACAEFFHIFYHLPNYQNSHHLTGFGLDKSKEELNIPNDKELDKIDLFTNLDLLKSGIREFYNWNHKEFAQDIKKVYRFLHFIINVDDFDNSKLSLLLHN